MSRLFTLILLIVSITFVITTNCYAARSTTDLIALYTLDEGTGTTIFDTSGATPPIDLINTTPAATAWIAGGLRANSSTAVSNEAVASKIITACMASNELTMEAWVQPGNLTQEGPARILTNSLNGSERNFTMGQQYTQYVFRIRTTETSLNGAPQLFAGTASTNLTHVVCTRASSGQVVVYVDSVAVSTTSIAGDFSNWDTTSYGFALFNEVNLSDRRWWGDMHLAAVYSRALSETEVQDNFNAGANPLIPTVTVSPTATPSATQSFTPTPSPSATPSATESATLTPSASATISPTESVTYTVTLTPTLTPTESATVTLTATISATATVSPTATSSSTTSPTFTITTTALTSSTISYDVIAGPIPARGDTLYFSYKLSEAATVINTIYNVAGEKVHVLRKEHDQSGVGQMKWDISNVAPGIYMYKLKLELNNGTKTDLPLKKVIIIKTK